MRMEKSEGGRVIADANTSTDERNLFAPQALVPSFPALKINRRQEPSPAATGID